MAKMNNSISMIPLLAGMHRYRQSDQAFSNVASGSPSRIKYSSNSEAIHTDVFKVKYNGADATEAQIISVIKSLDFWADGGEFCSFLPADVFKLNKFYGYPFRAGELPLYYTQSWRSNAQEAASHAFLPDAVSMPLMVANMNTFPAPTDEVELIQFLDTEGLGANNRAVLDASPGNAVNAYLNHWIDTIDIKSSGTAVPTRYIYEAGGDRIRGFHFEGANITRIRVLDGRKELLDFKSLADLNARIEDATGLNPQADTWHIVFEALGGSIHAALNLDWLENEDKHVTFEIFTSSTADARLIVERYDTPPRKR